MEAQALERYIEENTKSLKTVTGLKRLINELGDRSFYGRLGMSMLEYFKISAYLKEELDLCPLLLVGRLRVGSLFIM